MPPDDDVTLAKDRVRVQHMIDAAEQALIFINGRTRADLDRDAMLCRALMHALLEIGEAASRTSELGRSMAPAVPWKQIVASRNVLVHVYWGVNYDRVWRTAVEDLPELIRLLRAAAAGWPLPEAFGPAAGPVNETPP